MSERWQAPPQVPVSEAETVHVWRADLDHVAAAGGDFAGVLSPEERARAARLRYAHDRARFIAGRAVLHAIVARYLAIGPDRVHLAYTPFGKPYLPGAPESGRARLEFNMTHSCNLALYAFSLGRPVGIDVEQTRHVREAEVIVSSFFSPAESLDYRHLPEKEREIAFFHGWTRKEAWLKASGEGLAHPACQVEVSLAPNQGPELRRIDGDARKAAAWSLVDIDPGPGYVGALAVHGRLRGLCLWEFEPTSGDQTSWPVPGTDHSGRHRLS